ncbi:pro-cathepsin H-like isoform X3 [Pseudochaenichthys georgianus]
MTFEEFRKLFLLTEPQLNGLTRERFSRIDVAIHPCSQTVTAVTCDVNSPAVTLNKPPVFDIEAPALPCLLSEANCSATTGGHLSMAGPYPEFVDWRMKGNVVTPVKNQGHCGSCWTFSTTGCLESVNAIATGKLITLSEQQLIDCAQDFNNQGCMGGLPSQAFEYIKYNNGLMTEEDYPYKGYDDTCHFEPALAAAFVLDVVNITSYDEKAMVDAVARLNPVSFGFEVTADFMHYKEGVYTSTQCKSTADMVNHAVLAVGYGTEENSTPYWIVKNSWGPAWGVDGYFLIEQGKNMCGLAACASYPLPLVT